MKLRIGKAIYGGAGLARIPAQSAGGASQDETGEAAAGSLAGKTVFVPYSLPGELVEAHLTGDHRGFSTAAVDAILEPSPQRVQPRCEYFPACGGCQYQHAGAEYQVRMKLDILTETLRRARLESQVADAGPITWLDGPAWGYRNRVRLQILSQKHPGRRDPDVALCYRERGTHRNVAIDHCPIAAPLIERAIAAVLHFGAESGIANLAGEIEFFSNDDESELLVSLWAESSRHASVPAEKQRTLDGFAESLKQLVPQLVGVGLLSSNQGSVRLMAQWGRSFLHYSVSGRSYRVSLGSFFQVNRFLLAGFLELVTGGRAGRLAWDLYAGVGFFTLGLGFDRVLAVEAAPSSAFDLKQNLQGTGHRAVHSATLDFLRKQPTKTPRENPDLILLDPPRAGLGPEISRQLVEIAAPEIIYISCDPATFARDLQALLQSRYRLQSLHLVDLFPQTFHLETVAVLQRKGSGLDLWPDG